MIQHILPSSGSDSLRLQAPREIIASTGDFGAAMESTDLNDSETVSDPTEDPLAEASMPFPAFGQARAVDLSGRTAATAQQPDAAKVESQPDPVATVALPQALQDPTQLSDITSQSLTNERQDRETPPDDAAVVRDGPAHPAESGLVQPSRIPVENLHVFLPSEPSSGPDPAPEQTAQVADLRLGRDLATSDQIKPFAGSSVAQAGLEAIALPEVAVQGEVKRSSNRGDSIWATREKLDLVHLGHAEFTGQAPVADHPQSDFVASPPPSSEPEAVNLQPDLTVTDDANQQVQSTALTPVLAETNRFSSAPLPPAAPNLPMTAPPDLARQVAQLVTMPESGGVEVLLNPEELGKMRFEILQTNDSVRVVLYAERSETLDMLRRHGDQLLQEFRQSGFSGTSLSFGQWGQQEKSGRQTMIYNPTETPLVEGHLSIPQSLVAAAHVAGQGLNLRL